MAFSGPVATAEFPMFAGILNAALSQDHLLGWNNSTRIPTPPLALKVGLKLNLQKTKIMASGPITSWEIDGETVKQCQALFLGAPKSLQMVIAAMKLKDAYSLEGKLWPT